MGKRLNGRKGRELLYPQRFTSHLLKCGDGHYDNHSFKSQVHEKKIWMPGVTLFWCGLVFCIH